MKLLDITNMLGVTNVLPSKVRPEKVEDTETPKVMQEPKEPRKKLFAWKALSRPVSKGLDQKKIRTLILIGIFISLFLLALQEFFLILGVLSLIFVSYWINQIPPEEMEYEITNQGIKYGGLFYAWEELKYFYLTRQGDLDVAIIDLVRGVPGRLFFTINKGDVSKVTEILKEYVNYLEEEPKTFVDKAYDSMTTKLDLDKK
jgi:hypothetical protein